MAVHNLTTNTNIALQTSLKTIKPKHAKPLPKHTLDLIKTKNKMRYNYKNTVFDKTKSTARLVQAQKRDRRTQCGKLEKNSRQHGVKPLFLIQIIVKKHNPIPILADNNATAESDQEKAKLIADKVALNVTPNALPSSPQYQISLNNFKNLHSQNQKLAIKYYLPHHQPLHSW